MKEKQRLQEEARQTKALILPTEEKEGPYNQYNLDNLRIRAWKIFERSINPTQVAFIGLFRPSIDNCYLPSSSILNLLNCTSNSTSPEKAKEINDLFNRYSMTAIKYIDPNLPRASQKGVKNVLDANQVKS